MAPRQICCVQHEVNRMLTLIEAENAEHSQDPESRNASSWPRDKGNKLKENKS
ncbi:hypothetical protein M413DRAFT_444659 [Hebeloma cylindrosporum]|uniref:Uncharacterized protein n=1 Tax=Hebeloma cylindrosporum TaxID=76867 RepID=A0A0C3C017_HEBCY|nr:hypothetical protein M413DRAFT_444659 [Hebeloma cylindrosporum h7]